MKKSILLILIVLFFLISNEKALSNPLMLINISFSTEELFTLKFLKIEIISPDSTLTWMHEINSKSEIDSMQKMDLRGFRQKGAMQIDNWFTKKGNYQIVLNYQIDSLNPITATSKQIIFANGKELFFNIQISFAQASKITFGPEHKISCFQESKLDLYYLIEFLIYRILPPDDKIKLVRKWIPKKK